MHFLFIEGQRQRQMPEFSRRHEGCRHDRLITPREYYAIDYIFDYEYAGYDYAIYLLNSHWLGSASACSRHFLH